MVYCQSCGTKVESIVKFCPTCGVAIATNEGFDVPNVQNQMNFITIFKHVVFKDYANFNGRARRKEYWMFYLLNVLAIIILFIPVIISTTGEGSKNESIGLLLLPTTYFLGTIIPWIALTTRRLHDTNHSGWWQLISFIPYVGEFVLFIFTVLDGNLGENNYGVDPKGREGTFVKAPKVNTTDLDTLEQLHSLLEKGVITQEEYDSKKAELL